MHTMLHEDVTTSAAPSRRRRVALVAAGLLSCVLPTVFTLNIGRMLVVGEPLRSPLPPAHRPGPVALPGLVRGPGPAAAGRLGGPPPQHRRRPAPPRLRGRRAGLLRGRSGWRRTDPHRPDRGDRRPRLGRAPDPAQAPARATGRPAAGAACSGHGRAPDAIRGGADLPAEPGDGSPRAEPALLRHGLVGDGRRGSGPPGCRRACCARRLSLWSAAVAIGTGMAGLALGESLPWSASTLVLGLVTGTVGLALASWPDRRSAAASAL